MLKKKKHQSKSHDPLRSEKPKKNVAFSLADEENADVRYDNTDVTLDELINSVRDSSDADADSAASAENEDLETLREEAEEMIERLTEEEAEEPSGDIGDTPDEFAHGECAEAASVTDKDGEDSAQTAEIADEKAFSTSDSPPAAEKSDPEDTDDVPSEDVQAKEVPTEEMQPNRTVFGSVLEQSPLAIWARPEYAAFRAEVQTADPPKACLSCAKRFEAPCAQQSPAGREA